MVVEYVDYDGIYLTATFQYVKPIQGDLTGLLITFVDIKLKVAL